MEDQRTDSHRTLSMILKRQPHLYDLHTHLLGMGNASFWVDHILMNEDIMPTNKNFRDKDNKRIRQELCPLVWDRIGNSGFVDGRKVAEFFTYLTTNIIVPNGKQAIGDTIKEIKRQKFSPVLEELIKERFLDELLDRSLTFKKNFSYDVILQLSDLGKGLGVKETICENIIQVAVTEKLGVYPPEKINFREWIIFNAREQKLQIVYGITVEELRNQVKYDGNPSSKDNEIARAYIINAFSMRNAEGTPARDVDLHNFHGSFTPDFYPRRFALKDSIYSQRLDILAALIAHIVERYQTCLPPIRYCEFSISANDLCRPWVFDVLRSVQFYDETVKVYSQINDKNLTYVPKEELSSFAQLVLYNHFPHLEFAFTGPARENNENVGPILPQVTYKFLAGFDRRRINAPQLKDPNEALCFLLEYPQQAILLMIKEIVRSKEEATPAIPANTTDQSTVTDNREGIFSNFLTKLDELKTKSRDMPGFYDWVVGLDLFGDELGYPYCPFVARRFIEYIQERRRIAKENNSKNIFGVRIHCGENVIFADDNTQAYRLFVAHMYIVFRCLRFLQQELEYGIRIGHGIAFDRILGGSMNITRHRKSSVLLAEIREHAKHLMKTIAFEVNITSNEYLLGQTLRQGNNRQPLRLDGLFGKIPIILATDDDGVWPIDQCAYTHPGHQSLVAEYCRAISSGLINQVDQLSNVLQATKNFCFWNTDGTMPKSADKNALPVDDILINTVIIHPDLTKRLLKLYGGKTIEIDPGFQRFIINTEGTDPVEWKNAYGALRVAFICICANHDKRNENEEKERRKKICQDYKTLFQGTDVEFHTIYNFWREVRSELIFSNATAETTETPEPGRHVLLGQDQHPNIVYCTPEPSSPAPSQYKPLTDFLHQYRWLGYTIHAYGNKVNIEKTINVIEQAINNAGSEEAYQNMTLYLYTNTKVYTYVPSQFRNKFTFKINPHSSKRDVKKESFLYVVCPRASAATAALHLICDKIQLNAPEDNSRTLFLYNEIGHPTESESSLPAPREIPMEQFKPNNNVDNIDNVIINLIDLFSCSLE